MYGSAPTENCTPRAQRTALSGSGRLVRGTVRRWVRYSQAAEYWCGTLTGWYRLVYVWVRGLAMVGTLEGWYRMVYFLVAWFRHGRDFGRLAQNGVRLGAWFRHG